MSITRVGVVGSGIMGVGHRRGGGGDRARRGAAQPEPGRARTPCWRACSKSLAKQVEKGKRTEEEAEEIAGRVRATTHLGELVDVDLVIESVVEDLAVKKELFAELDTICKPETILATNTSTLPVVEMAMATGASGPRLRDPLLQSGARHGAGRGRPADHGSDATVAAAVAFAGACGKEPVEVKDQAGFIVNALLFPYLNNAVRMFEQGVASKEGIDAAMKGGCGFPMGPFALLDLVGLDTSLAILDALYEEYRDPNYAAVPAAAPARHLGAARSQVQEGLLRLRPLTGAVANAESGRMVVHPTRLEVNVNGYRAAA